MQASLCDSDCSENAVIAILQGEGAAKFAKETCQSLNGSNWECDGNDFAYCLTENCPSLLEEFQKDLGDIEINDSEYTPIT